ncbi:MAG: hypothetical protein ACM3NH_02435 [Candidatus Saccharibacteria bacterium]
MELSIGLGVKKGKTIEVAALEEFPESRWRQAMLRFLFGIWSGDSVLCARPEIFIQGVTLRLFNNRYVAFGAATSFEEPPVVPIGESLLTTDRKADVEVALMRFVKNDRIKMVTLSLGQNHDRFLAFWKKERRGEFGFWVKGIPETWTANC